MKKKTQILFLSLWGMAVAGSRICYLLLKRQSVVDAYEYFADAMIRTEKGSETFLSGLSYAYTKSLSGVLLFAGNRMEAVCIYQVILQILWIILLFTGVGLIFGRLAGIVSATIMAVLPMTFCSITELSTENFLMLHLSLNLIVLGIFYLQVQKAGWYERRYCELYLLIAGFYTGVISVWNYTGFLLIIVVIYILIRNYLGLKEKIKEQKNIKDQKLKDQIMGAGYQGFLLFTGMLAGMFATLMKYTGVTGYTLKEQFDWWRFQFGSFPGRCQDISTWFAIALLGAVFAGILCQSFLKAENTKISDAVEDEMAEGRKEEEYMEEKQSEYVITEDGRKIRLLDNPLPTPKKHIKREMDFDFEFDDATSKKGEKNVKIDFDVEIDDDDDFDFD